MGADVEVWVQSCTGDSEQRSQSRGYCVVHMTARQHSEPTPETCAARKPARMPPPYTSTGSGRAAERRHLLPSASPPCLSAAAGVHEMKRNTCWQLRARSLRVGRQHQNLSLTHSCCANSCALLGTISIRPRYERIPIDAVSEVCYDAGSQHGTFCRWKLDVEL